MYSWSNVQSRYLRSKICAQTLKHHVISVASMTQWKVIRCRGAMARVRGTMASVVSYEIVIKRLIYYPWGMRICDYEQNI